MIGMIVKWDVELARAVAPLFYRFHPNIITAGTLVLAVAALWFMIDGEMILGAVLLFASRWGDNIDGTVARATNRATSFGGAFDAAVGFGSIAGVMAVLGITLDDGLLLVAGPGVVCFVHLLFVAAAPEISRRAGSPITVWVPVPFLEKGQPAWTRTAKSVFDFIRNDWLVVVFAAVGAIHAWAWVRTVGSLGLSAWFLYRTVRFLKSE